MLREALGKQEVINAIERKGDGRIPLLFHKWWGNGLAEKYGDKLQHIASRYPDDIFTAWYTCTGDDKSTIQNPSFRWGFKEDYSNTKKHGIGEKKELLNDWSIHFTKRKEGCC